MSYQVTANEFEALRLMGFNQMQVRDLCIRLDDKKKDTEDFKEARKIVETVYNTYLQNKPKPKGKAKIEKQGKFSLGSYKYKAR